MEKLEAVKKMMNKSVGSIVGDGNQEIPTCKGRKNVPGFSWENIEYARNEWKMPENSTIIASYLKTGTLWCGEIMQQILCGEDDALLNELKSLPETLRFLEFAPKEKLDVLQYLPLRLYVTHIAADLFNFAELKRSNSKVIYMYRNPKDQAVSWFHFAHKIPHFTDEQKRDILGKEWNEFITKYTAGEHPTGMAEGEWYPDHVVGWMKKAEESDNILPVAYESLKKDFKAEVKRIATFLGVDVNEKDLERIQQRCTLSAMKKEAAIDKRGIRGMNLRKGEVGGWKEQFTVSQSELMDRIMEEKLAGTGINFTYEL